jgi:hypothetical protein
LLILKVPLSYFILLLNSEKGTNAAVFIFKG